MNKYDELVAKLRAAPLQPHAKQFVDALIDSFEAKPAPKPRKKTKPVTPEVDVVRDDDPAPTDEPEPDTPPEN